MNIKIVTRDEMRQIEAAADAGGLSYDRMMETAGQQVVEAMDAWMGVEGMEVLVLVGPGNNGGDGLVAARHLLERGASVRVYTWNREPANGDENWRQATALGIPTQRAEEDADRHVLRQWVAQADMIVDALLGTGARLPLSEEIVALLEVVRETFDARRCPLDAPLCAPAEGLVVTNGPIVVAVDLPSGLETDSGKLDPHVLPADMTVTFGAAKWGQFMAAGPQAVGKLVVADIGIPATLLQGITAELLTAAGAAALLTRRSATDEQWPCGQVLVVAGSVNEPGAAWLAASAATRVGAGAVTVGLPQVIYPLVAPWLPEARYLLLPHDMGMLAPAAERVLQPEMERFQVCLFGPGLGKEKTTGEWLHKMLGETAPTDRRRVGFRRQPEPGEADNAASLPPLVLDAESILLLKDVAGWWQRLPADTILILNDQALAEMAGDATSDRQTQAVALARQWRQVLVLTGACTLAAAPDGRLTALPFANHTLAAAGSGHVLAGAITGARARGLAAYEAALLGSYLHGLAGALAQDAAAGQCQTGILASDLLPLLPRAAGRLRGME